MGIKNLLGKKDESANAEDVQKLREKFNEIVKEDTKKEEP